MVGGAAERTPPGEAWPETRVWAEFEREEEGEEEEEERKYLCVLFL